MVRGSVRVENVTRGNMHEYFRLVWVCRVLRAVLYIGVGFERKEKFMVIVITIYAVIVTVLFIISLNA